MSGIADISALYTKNTTEIKTTNSSAGSTSLDMDDFLQLMVAQFQNQDPENAADTSDMLNQMVQMAVYQAINNITDSTTMMYQASLVGQEVTVGVYDEKGVLTEIVGNVTATGTYGGEPVIFIGDDCYYLSDIMAIGKLPEIKKEEEKDPEDEKTDDKLPPVDPNQPTDPASLVVQSNPLDLFSMLDLDD